jgi:hypothetical protein
MRKKRLNKVAISEVAEHGKSGGRIMSEPRREMSEDRLFAGERSIRPATRWRTIRFISQRPLEIGQFLLEEQMWRRLCRATA